jgi:hypothetical protein
VGDYDNMWYGRQNEVFYVEYLNKLLRLVKEGKKITTISMPVESVDHKFYPKNQEGLYGGSLLTIEQGTLSNDRDGIEFNHENIAILRYYPNMFPENGIIELSFKIKNKDNPDGLITQIEYKLDSEDIRTHAKTYDTEWHTLEKNANADQFNLNTKEKGYIDKIIYLSLRGVYMTNLILTEFNAQLDLVKDNTVFDYLMPKNNQAFFQNVNITVGNTTTNRKLIIEGKLVDINNQIIANKTIDFICNETSDSTSTDGTGAFKFEKTFNPDDALPTQGELRSDKGDDYNMNYFSFTMVWGTA